LNFVDLKWQGGHCACPSVVLPPENKASNGETGQNCPAFFGQATTGNMTMMLLRQIRADRYTVAASNFLSFCLVQVEVFGEEWAQFIAVLRSTPVF
jgi:hypothetical protein